MPQKKEERQKSAEKLLIARANRTPQEQITLLDQRLGEGQGAVKERRRLQSLIQQQNNGTAQQ